MRRSKIGYVLFLLPCVASFTIIVLIPMFTGFYYSFTDWNGIGNTPNLVGFSNYIDIFKDESFLKSFTFTAGFAVVAVILINVIGFLLALLVNQKFKGNKVMRTVFFMPNLIGGILLGFTWNFIFVSVFESIYKATGFNFFSGWLSTTVTGFWGLVIVLVWQMSGYTMLIYIAALQNIQTSVLEAAELDGAIGLRKLFSIIIPMVMPAFTISLFLTLSNSFKLFDQNLALTGGAPNKSTMMLALKIYNTAFSQNTLGKAQAMAIIFLIVVAIISVTQLSITKRREIEN